MIIELLKNTDIKKQIINSYLLFPTIERMAISPSGKILINFTKPLVPILVFLSWIFSVIPSIFKNSLFYLYLKLSGAPESFPQALIDMIKPSVLKRIFFLAFQEMEMVTERNNEAIKENKEIIKLYYGESDGWAPKNYYYDIQKDIPDIDAELCRKNYEHAFVAKNSIEVADMVGDWILTGRN